MGIAKSKYESHVLPNLDKIKNWAEQGAPVKEIAKKLKVSYSCLRKYIDDAQAGAERYKALLDVYAPACIVADEAVEAALYKLATGYNATIVKHYKLKRVEYDPDTGRKIAEVEELRAANDEVHVSANATAQQFWLANRRPDRWKYKPEEKSGDGGGDSGVIFMPAVKEDS